MKVPEDSIPISELGEVVICERRVYLRSKYGQRTSAQREGRLKRGNDVHKAAYAQKAPDQVATDKRCFIATAVFGEDAPETNHLRRWRDETLMPSKVGRVAVAVYYRVSPAVAEWCDGREGVRKVIAKALSVVVKMTGGRR